MKTPEEAIKDYRPQAGTCSDEVWQAVATTVRTTVTDAGVAISGRQVRPYLGTLTGLLVWMHGEGYEPDVDLALAGPTIEAYVATLTTQQATHRSRLRKLARGNGIDPDAGVAAQYPKREHQPPYNEGEVTALWAHGVAIAPSRRGHILCAAVALGAGCGLRSRELRHVRAADIHTHNGRYHVRVNGRCIPARAGYQARMRYVATNWPDGGGALVGNATSANALNKVWTAMRNKPGGPDVNPYRLRSTWLCTMLASDVAVTRILAWAGLTKLAALDGYRQHLHTEDVTCRP